jgi:D-arginine dehydrogenase
MQVDYLVIGAGISGAAAANELARYGSVALIEAEASPGYHSTGRSAALYTRNFGNLTVRRINQASHAFFTDPPVGFAEGSILTPRGSLTIATAGEQVKLAPILALSATGNEIVEITAERAVELAPLLRIERVAAAAYEPGVMDIDVAALHHGYLRAFRRRGGLLIVNRRIGQLTRRNGCWQATAGDVAIKARIIINAAGAWADQIGELAGAIKIGLVAKRRTAIIVAGPADVNTKALPAVDFVASAAYFKPDAGRIMASPGDESAIEPQDVQPDDYDVAALADWLERETLIKVTRIEAKWAGLRSFVGDESPVVGFDPKAPDFFWLAGQGGYGIMMAPALGCATAGLIVRDALPDGLLQSGITAAALSPTRFK